MSYLDLVQRGIDYIEEHLEDELEPAQVASHAGMSQWHFQKIFKGLTHETLKCYIRSRRFAKALNRLSRRQGPILDIALEAGFESQAAFTRAFKSNFGVSPSAYRAGGQTPPFPSKVRFDRSYLEHIQHNLSLEPERIHQPARQFVGMATSFYGTDSEKNNFSDKLPQLWTDFMPRAHEINDSLPGFGYGILTQTAADSDLLSYCAALEVTHIDSLPEGMVALQLPAQDYARFTHRGLLSGLDHTVNYIYSNWLLRSGLRHSGTSDLEVYGPSYLENSDASEIHYLLPVS